MIHRNKIFTNFATSNKDYPVHSSSGLGRRPLTAETRVRSPDALQKKPADSFRLAFLFSSFSTDISTAKKYYPHPQGDFPPPGWTFSPTLMGNTSLADKNNGELQNRTSLDPMFLNLS